MPMEFQSTKSPRRKPPDVYLHTYCQPTNVQSSVDLAQSGQSVCPVPMSSPSTLHSVIDSLDDSPTQSTRKW